MRRMYSENQLKEVIQEGIDEQSIKLYEDLDIASSLTITFGSLSGMTSEKQYCKIRKTKEDELYLVLNFSITNETESSISLGNNISLSLLLPEEIASKIYDVNGKTMHDQLVANAGITGGYAFMDNGVPTGGYFVSKIISFMNTLSANTASLQIRDAGNISAGATHNYTFRVFLTL